MPISEAEARTIVENSFADAGVGMQSIDARSYPDETIFVVKVSAEFLIDAIRVASTLDKTLADRGFRGFVTVRELAAGDLPPSETAVRGVQEARATDLVHLLAARSRTSEVQPSLAYIPDVSNNIAVATAPRHHLVFGRRGAGKTALLVETKRRVEAEGHISVWLNMQTYRRESLARAFLWICRSICDATRTVAAGRSAQPQVILLASQIDERIRTLLAREEVTSSEAHALVPEMQRLIRRLQDSTGSRLYVFLDDFHYFAGKQQPQLLDLVHGVVRDCDAWVKVSAIQHLTRWFEANPPAGLQTGQDADVIDLDITLENPSRAKEFLERVLASYALSAGVKSLSGLFLATALDRLVLASGAVPRDYLVLCAASVKQAQGRANAKTVGVQDVNKAAGSAAKVKIAELEDDAASVKGRAEAVLATLDTVRQFCLERRHCTFFRVDFQQKERGSAEYALLEELMDLRLVHLLHKSLSDEHEAGRRSEVFMLDLSQFSGERLKKQLRVLDFVRGLIVVKQTGTTSPVRLGDTPRRLLGLLRRGPLFDLGSLRETATGPLGHSS